MLVKQLFTVASAVFAGVVAAAAQAPEPPAKATAPFVEPKLSFNREVFTYPGEGRRDPFQPQSGDNALGPLFEDLVLRGIIWSPVPRNGLVLVNDGSKKLYRLRVGDEVGNARVVAIEKDRVRFAVQSYGMVRQEIMYKAQRETVSDIRRQQADDPAKEQMGRMIQQELLRVLQSSQDTTRRSAAPPPPLRRDSVTGVPRPRNEER